MKFQPSAGPVLLLSGDGQRLEWAQNGEPGWFPASLISIRRSMTPAISAVVDHVPA